jgi:hypothetical protein
MWLANTGWLHVIVTKLGRGFWVLLDLALTSGGRLVTWLLTLTVPYTFYPSNVNR